MFGGNTSSVLLLTFNAKKVWSAVRSKATRHNLWFMQDGATCHTTENNLSILKEEFNGRIISNKTDMVWPPNYPDLNLLDYFFWGFIKQESLGPNINY